MPSYVVLGHVGAGKSCLCGRMILDCGGQGIKELIQKYREEVKNIGSKVVPASSASDTSAPNLFSSLSEEGSPRFKSFAWLTDRLTYERHRGQSIQNTVWCLEVSNQDSKEKKTKAARKITFIDSPGRIKSSKRIHDACSLADAAILVISAIPHEFENSLFQFRQYASIAMASGISNFVIVISKMDHPLVSYSKSRFEDVSKIVKSFLSSRLKSLSTKVVPLSSFTGANVIKASPRSKNQMPWYGNETLLSALLTSNLKRDILLDKPLRIGVHRVFKIFDAGMVITGRVMSGSINVGQNIVIMPPGIEAKVKSIEIHYEKVHVAEAGCLVGIAIEGGYIKNQKNKGHGADL
eukprot:CAMPEP_0167770664 /NCGR_PEP_ID=MMETSP0110_2-20121227/18064_1 /TAXON_ID=629695 /ORGANISM="Gymnochlora sp., Strain CCMP2014" /LENGTH=350 /DNA_ID=CAMNT_0007659905 /DNA_START=57 /DNA_END=1110 /DNA_ORIENTATION=-